MKKILLTGSEGYIGRNLNYHFTQNGYEVVQCDRRIGIKMEEAADLTRPDVVINCAAFVNIGLEGDLCQLLIKDNIVDLQKIVEFCSSEKIPFIHFSSSGIWQKDEIGLYVESKKMGELIVKEILDRWIIIRPSNVVGSIFNGGFDTLRNNHILPVLYNCSIQKKPFFINGDGRQIRDYIYVEYICKRLQKVLESSWENQVIEGCSGKTYRILEVVERWKREVDSELEVIVTNKKRRSDPDVLDPINFGAIPLEGAIDSLEVALAQYKNLFEGSKIER